MLLAASACKEHKPIPAGDFTLNNDSTSVYKIQKVKTNLSIKMRDGTSGEVYAAKILDSVSLTGLKNFSLEDILSAIATPSTPVVYAQYDDILVDRFLLRETKKTRYSYCAYSPRTKTINFWQDKHLVVITEYKWIRFTVLICVLLVTGVFCTPSADDRIPKGISAKMVYQWASIFLAIYLVSLFFIYFCNNDLLLLNYKIDRWYEMLILYIGSLFLPMVFYHVDLFIQQRRTVEAELLKKSV